MFSFNQNKFANNKISVITFFIILKYIFIQYFSGEHIWSSISGFQNFNSNIEIEQLHDGVKKAAKKIRILCNES